jgi:hypothetical protein
LKLREARHSGNPKKIVDTLNQLLGVEGVTTRIPHLEGKEFFGSSKRKLDPSPSFHGDSYRLGKVNFPFPRMQTRSRMAHIAFVEASAMVGEHE